MSYRIVKNLKNITLRVRVALLSSQRRRFKILEREMSYNNQRKSPKYRIEYQISINNLNKNNNNQAHLLYSKNMNLISSTMRSPKDHLKLAQSEDV